MSGEEFPDRFTRNQVLGRDTVVTHFFGLPEAGELKGRPAVTASLDFVPHDIRSLPAASVRPAIDRSAVLDDHGQRRHDWCRRAAVERSEEFLHGAAAQHRPAIRPAGDVAATKRHRRVYDALNTDDGNRRRRPAGSGGSDGKRSDHRRNSRKRIRRLTRQTAHEYAAIRQTSREHPSAIDLVFPCNVRDDGPGKSDVINPLLIGGQNAASVSPPSFEPFRVGDDESLALGDLVETARPLLLRPAQAAAMERKYQRAVGRRRHVHQVLTSPAIERERDCLRARFPRLRTNQWRRQSDRKADRHCELDMHGGILLRQ